MNQIVWRPFSHRAHLKGRHLRSEFAISRLSCYQAVPSHTSYSFGSWLISRERRFTDSLQGYDSSKEWVEACPKVQRHLGDLVHQDSKHPARRLGYPLPMFLHPKKNERAPFVALVKCHSKFEIRDC